jgi:hypothetical protein
MVELRIAQQLTNRSIVFTSGNGVGAIITEPEKSLARWRRASTPLGHMHEASEALG